MDKYLISVISQREIVFRREIHDLTSERDIQEALPIMTEQTKRGRPKLNFEQVPGRFPAGTIARIDSVRQDGETRTSFIQVAVEAEIVRRGGAAASAEALDPPDE